MPVQFILNVFVFILLCFSSGSAFASLVGTGLNYIYFTILEVNGDVALVILDHLHHSCLHCHPDHYQQPLDHWTRGWQLSYHRSIDKANPEIHLWLSHSNTRGKNFLFCYLTNKDHPPPPPNQMLPLNSSPIVPTVVLALKTNQDFEYTYKNNKTWNKLWRFVKSWQK